MEVDDFTSEDDGEATRRRGRGQAIGEVSNQQQQSWLSFSTKVAEASAGAVVSKAGRLKQKALSVVDTVQTLSSHNSSNSCTITVKSSPPRTAAEMTRLSVRRGWMLKRNEQRAWQRRYCCLVPHTFLYYFESKDSEVPRGIIDLDPYTDIEVDQVTGAIVLSPGSDTATAPTSSGQGLRKFYLRPEERRRLQKRSVPAAGVRAAPAAAAANEGGEAGSGSEAGAVVERGALADGGNRGEEEKARWVADGAGGDGGEVLAEWLSGFHRERYKVVRDERDAYMNLQEEYMAQMQDTTSAMSEAESERARVLQGLRAEHAAARAAAKGGLEQARQLFRDEGLPPEEAASLPLPALLARVRAVASDRRSGRARLEAELAEALGALRGARGGEDVSRSTTERLREEAEESAARARDAKIRLARAEEDAAHERGLRVAAESSLKACTERLEAALVDAEQGQVNLGIMAGERRSAVAKAAELTEQKRLLVREVKTLRRSLAEASSVNRRLARAYESLERSLRASSTPAGAPQLLPMVEAAATVPAAAGSVRPPSPSVDTKAAAGSRATTPSTTAATTPDHSPVAGAVAVVGAEGPIAAAAAAGTAGCSGCSGGGGGFATPPRGAQPARGPESPVGAFFAGSGEWRGARIFSGGGSGTGGSATSGGDSGGGGAWSGDKPLQNFAARIQVRDLSTGDVGVLDPLGDPPRGRASTEGGGPLGDWAPTAWEPHSSNLGLKITQKFASASWPWTASKDGAEAAAPAAAAAVPSRPPSPLAAGDRLAARASSVAYGPASAGDVEGIPAKSGDAQGASYAGPGQVDDGNCRTDVGGGGLVGAYVVDAAPAAAAAAATTGGRHQGTGSGGRGRSSYSAFVGAFESVASSMGNGGDNSSSTGGGLAGEGGGGGARGNGRVRARSGMANIVIPSLGIGTVVPSLHLDDDVDKEEEKEDVGDARVGADDVIASAVGGEGGRGREGGDARDGAAGWESTRRGSVEAVLCRRCGGTVEGPLNSTCTCTVPELDTNPVDRRSTQASAGLSRLKGVLKSLNGGVEVARQMLDAAVRQNVANNVPAPPRPPQPAALSGGSGRRRTLSSAHGSSAHGSSSHGSSGIGSLGNGDSVVAPTASPAGAAASAAGAGCAVDGHEAAVVSAARDMGTEEDNGGKAGKWAKSEEIRVGGGIGRNREIGCLEGDGDCADDESAGDSMSRADMETTSAGVAAEAERQRRGDALQQHNIAEEGYQQSHHTAKEEGHDGAESHSGSSSERRGGLLLPQPPHPAPQTAVVADMTQAKSRDSGSAGSVPSSSAAGFVDSSELAAGGAVPGIDDSTTGGAGGEAAEDGRSEETNCAAEAGLQVDEEARAGHGLQEEDVGQEGGAEGNGVRAVEDKERSYDQELERGAHDGEQ